MLWQQSLDVSHVVSWFEFVAFVRLTVTADSDNPQTVNVNIFKYIETFPKLMRNIN